MVVKRKAMETLPLEVSEPDVRDWVAGRKTNLSQPYSGFNFAEFVIQYEILGRYRPQSRERRILFSFPVACESEMRASFEEFQDFFLREPRSAKLECKA
jgi:hypothetical protein